MRCPNCPNVKSKGEEIEWLCNHGPVVKHNNN